MSVGFTAENHENDTATLSTLKKKTEHREAGRRTDWWDTVAGKSCTYRTSAQPSSTALRYTSSIQNDRVSGATHSVVLLDIHVWSNDQRVGGFMKLILVIHFESECIIYKMNNKVIKWTKVVYWKCSRGISVHGGLDFNSLQIFSKGNNLWFKIQTFYRQF